MAERPQLWVIAGPNGSGKTTMTEARNIQTRMPVLNPDEIVKSLPDQGPVQAGKMVIREQKRLLSRRSSFARETTLSGRDVLKLMRTAKTLEYKVNIVFIGLDSPGMNMRRVRQRVEAGGHDIPSEDVSRRYARSMENLPEAIAIADRSFVLDNSASDQKRSMSLVFSREGGRIKHISKDMPRWALKPLREYLKEMEQLA